MYMLIYHRWELVHYEWHRFHLFCDRVEIQEWVFSAVVGVGVTCMTWRRMINMAMSQEKITTPAKCWAHQKSKPNQTNIWTRERNVTGRISLLCLHVLLGLWHRSTDHDHSSLTVQYAVYTTKHSRKSIPSSEDKISAGSKEKRHCKQFAHRYELKEQKERKNLDHPWVFWLS